MPRDIRYTNRKYIIGGIAVAVVLVYIIRLFALQITLVAAAGNGTDSDMRILNIVTGFAVCVFTIALGVFMIIRASRKLRAEKESI